MYLIDIEAIYGFGFLSCLNNTGQLSPIRFLLLKSFVNLSGLFKPHTKPKQLRQEETCISNLGFVIN